MQSVEASAGVVPGFSNFKCFQGQCLGLSLIGNGEVVGDGPHGIDVVRVNTILSVVRSPCYSEHTADYIFLLQL